MARVHRVEAPLALYRRYRPETFAEVIGQDHVTEPLRVALANNRVNHAYLFSGPRGCGKTTSARILARALNCEKAPVADPCGACDSCRDLARGGSGSIDVIEIDAASHGGVDDARELREKAFFAPVKSRYKVYIIDEAHMVSSQGFNALLKLVEEPPPHLRFIFATTEPDKVIPTIRSRTHHYPFRLIPPRLLTTYLGELCDKEGVAIEQAALPLVVRAGGGSARDTLSVLDQLLGGAGPQGVTHALATALLGYTPDNLLDEIVDAFAAHDGPGVFRVVDRVIETGQDPRRFTEDLLRRLRDLVIVAAVPEALATGLIDVAEDAGERLVAQAQRFGAIQLSRAADLVATGLTEMRGATAPRLLLELICARVLLPAADDTSDGVLARLERLERRVSVVGSAAPEAAAPAAPVSRPATVAPPTPAAPPVQQESAPADDGWQTPPSQPAPESAPRQSAAPAPQQPDNAVHSSHQVTESLGTSAPGSDAGPQLAQSAPPAAEQPAAAAPGALSLADVRRLWPDIVERTKTMRRVTWIHLTQHAQVVAVDGTTLTLGFTNSGARESFVNGGSAEIVRQAAIDTVGQDWRVEAIVDPGAQPQAAQPAYVTPQAPPTDRGPAPDAGTPQAPPAPQQAPQPSAPEPQAEEQSVQASPEALAQARGAISPTRPAGAPAQGDDDRAAIDAQASRDDPDAEATGLGGAELLQRELGATIIDETPHE